MSLNGNLLGSYETEGIKYKPAPNMLCGNLGFKADEFPSGMNNRARQGRLVCAAGIATK